MSRERLFEQLAKLEQCSTELEHHLAEYAAARSEPQARAGW
jgi:hypothetical protein